MNNVLARKMQTHALRMEKKKMRKEYVAVTTTLVGLMENAKKV